MWGRGSSCLQWVHGAGGPAVYRERGLKCGCMGQSVTVGTWGQGQSGGRAVCNGYIYMKAGGPIHVHGAGLQLLTVGTWAACPADSGYIRAARSS